MDIGLRFRKPFEDPSWPTKTAIAVLVGLGIITAPALFGYGMAYVRNVARGDERLPEWNDFVSYWGQGFLVVIASIPYFIVGLLLFGIGIIAAAILLYAAVVEFAMTERWGSMFALGTIWRRIKENSSFWSGVLVLVVINVASNGVARLFMYGNRGTFGSWLVGGIIWAFTTLIAGSVFGGWAATAFGTPGGPVGGYAPPPPGYMPPPPGGYTPPPAGDYPEPPAPTTGVIPPAPSGFMPPSPPAPRATPASFIPPAPAPGGTAPSDSVPAARDENGPSDQKAV